LLMLLARVYREGGALPNNRSLLYDRFVKWLHQREHLKDACYDARFIQDILEVMAFKMQLAGKVSGYSTEFVTWLANSPLIESVQKSVNALLDQLIRGGWLLDVAGGLRFRHQTFQEFLAGEYLSKHPEELVDSMLKNESWQEVLVFLVGLVRDNRMLLEKIRKKAVAPKVIAATVATTYAAINEYESQALNLDVKHRIEFMQELRGRTDIDLRKLIDATLKEIQGPGARTYAQDVGLILRYREKPAEWLPVVNLLEKSQDRGARWVAAKILAIGQAPLLRDLITKSINEFIGELQAWTKQKSTGIRQSLLEFVLTGGLERLTSEEKAKARILSLGLLTCMPQLSGERRKDEIYKYRVLAIRTLCVIGQTSDLEQAVKAIPIQKNSIAAQSIRALMKHQPRGLLEVIENVLQKNQPKHAISVAAVAALIAIKGDGAETRIQEFVKQNPERFGRVVTAAKLI